MNLLEQRNMTLGTIEKVKESILHDDNGYVVIQATLKEYKFHY